MKKNPESTKAKTGVSAMAPQVPRRVSATKGAIIDPHHGMSLRFILHAPQATQVALCGDFNAWSQEAMRQTQAGQWEASKTLPPGQYEYKFLVDGQWIQDPQARESVPNPFGTSNSVVKVEIQSPKP